MFQKTGAPEKGAVVIDNTVDGEAPKARPEEAEELDEEAGKEAAGENASREGGK